jgi:nucleoside-diphosphate-sugar epimerase
LSARADEKLVAQIVREHRVEAIIHFAASIVVPDSVADPFGTKNNTAASRALIERAVKKMKSASHFFVDRSGLPQSGARPGNGGCSDPTDLCLRPFEARCQLRAWVRFRHLR